MTEDKYHGTAKLYLTGYIDIVLHINKEIIDIFRKHDDICDERLDIAVGNYYEKDKGYLSSNCYPIVMW